MSVTRFGRQAKRSYGFCIKITAVGVLGLCFVLIWSLFSSSSVAYQRSTFGDFSEPVSANAKDPEPQTHSVQKEPIKDQVNKEDKKSKSEFDLAEKDKKKVSGSEYFGHKGGNEASNEKKEEKKPRSVGSEGEVLRKEDSGEKEEVETNDKEEEGAVDGEREGSEDLEHDIELIDGVDVNQEATEDESDGSKIRGKKKRTIGPLFDPKAHYTWKLCSTRSKHNYIPCIDVENTGGRLQPYRHRERSCPRSHPMCLIPLPHEGYGNPVRWPESKLKVLYKNVAHPKLAAFVKTQTWVEESGEYLTFSQNQTDFKGGIMHYLDSIEEMVPDIEWGKNIRLVLDIGCTGSSFAGFLLDKDVLTLTLGLKDDLVDLSQVSLERGFPAVVSPFGNKRLPFPSIAFDAIHCGECPILWHSNGGKLLLEMNRVLRPGGYFILSTKQDSMEVEEAMSTLTASICWNILSHKTDEISEVGVKIYQKPESNDIYELRRKKSPPLCKEDENPDAAWYTPIKNCLHTIPSSIEQRGTEWPEEWSKRLETYPDWMNNKEKLIADTQHWKAIVDRSYLNGMDIDWSNIRNIMDMNAINGGFAAALFQKKVWVMNVVPVHAPDTLPIIFERGLVGVYHDWCESFSTYPRSYDLLHADHLYSTLKNRCKQPVAIVVEMDRLVRPSGWAIIRDKVEILGPLEGIFRSLHWEIHMTYNQDKEGIMCVQKTIWRP